MGNVQCSGYMERCNQEGIVIKDSLLLCRDLNIILMFDRKLSIEHCIKKRHIQMQKNGLAIFRPVTVQICGALGEAQLFSTFTLRQPSQTTALIGLTTNYLLYFQDEKADMPSGVCSLCFDLKFQILREPKMHNQCTPGKPLGIRFELEIEPKSFQTLQLFSSNPHVLTSWLHYLEGYLNQRNFHGLFKAKRKIGSGAFGTVYLTERLLDHKIFAIKAFLKQKQYSGQKGRQSLENQIKLMRAVEDKNIIKLEGVYQTENSIYMVLQMMEGRHLHERLKDKQMKNPEVIRDIIYQILSGLKALAKKNIIHRDLKPDNIMFRKQGKIDLAIGDFGLATFAHEEEYLFVRCGTPGFVSPEIINIPNIEDVRVRNDPISDVFSAGLIFHLLVFGQSIFEGRRYNEILTSNRSCNFNFNKPLYKDADPMVKDLMIKMLQLDPQMRICAQKAMEHPYFRNSQLSTKFQRLPIIQEMVDEKEEKFTTDQSKTHKHPYFTRHRNAIRPRETHRERKNSFRTVVIYHDDEKENRADLSKIPLLKKGHSEKENHNTIIRKYRKRSTQEAMKKE